MNNLLRLLAYDLRLITRQKTDIAALVLFFLIVIILLPFTLGPDTDTLRRLAPALIWLAILLMNLLALDRMFVQDARDGTLDIMMMASLPLSLQIFSRLIAQSIVTLGVLLGMLAPAAVLLNLDPSLLPVMLISMGLGVPSLIFLGGIMAAITIGLPRHPALMILLLIPFYIPILIFATSAADHQAMGTSPTADLLFLSAFLAVLIPTAPLVITATLRHGNE